jgi:hypothetical protein
MLTPATSNDLAGEGSLVWTLLFNAAPETVTAPLRLFGKSEFA